MTGTPYDHLTPGDLDTIEQRLGSSGLFLAHARTDVTRLLGEVRRLRLAHELQSHAHAYLLAAARAAVAAHRDGEPDPLAYLHDHLDAQGQLPGRHEQLTGLPAHTAALRASRPPAASPATA
jgi:hypothetical protein